MCNVVVIYTKSGTLEKNVLPFSPSDDDDKKQQRFLVFLSRAELGNFRTNGSVKHVATGIRPVEQIRLFLYSVSPKDRNSTVLSRN